MTMHVEGRHIIGRDDVILTAIFAARQKSYIFVWHVSQQT